jgi:hypothetical protein
MVEAPAQLMVRTTEETLAHWAEHLLPRLDVWYWDDDALDLDLSGCMVLPRADYLKHPTFQDITYVNAYLHWQMPSNVSRIIVSGPDWVTRLDDADRAALLGKQVALKRGLVVPLSFLDRVPFELRPYVTGDSVVLCHASWKGLPSCIQQGVLRHEQRRWDDVESYAVPANAPTHIRDIANTFGTVEGANCLGTTAFCVTGESWMRDHWMHQGPFLSIIERHGYRPDLECAPSPGDIVVFESNDTVVHAAYCVDEDRFINKNGQSRFNPVRVVDWAMLSVDWDSASCTTWRRSVTGPSPLRSTI